MTVRFWGVRGSIPTPLSNEAIEAKLVDALRGAQGLDLSDEQAVRDYVSALPLHMRGSWGGNTTCVEVRNNAGDLLIIDAGTGIRELGQHLLSSEFGKGQGRGAIVFTHTHWDHIQGFPFFVPLFIPGNRFDLYACHDHLEDRLRYQQAPKFFPATLEMMAADKTYHQMLPTMELFDGRMKVSAMEMDHPGQAFAYRVEADGHSMVMATDAEYRDLVGDYWQKYVDFFRSADVLVFDAQYTLREALVEKQNWGHSSAMIGIDLAVDARVETMVFVHHEPTYPDDKINQIFHDAMRYLDRVPASERPRVVVGYEGMAIEL
ncbi:MAG: MBL fold metallo-hydrolase [Armatimonadetes bacterium]|nr:MBL fold metallo-hydrolase [Armatimonadota bacterium]